MRHDPKGYTPLVSEFLTPADAEAAAANWERWLAITGNQAVHREAQESVPLTVIFGASQQLSESIIQNPELAYSLLDEEWLVTELTVAEVLREGDRLMRAAPSHSYKLDRLRYLKQWLGLRVAARDLLDLAPQPQIWRELSALADGIVQLAHAVVWENFALERQVEAPNPVAVFAFGKLGGSEVNYSSDIDLVYVIPDDAPEIEEKLLIRYCERLGRSLSDAMGRGALYRVDLRLRPYGTSGPIFLNMTAWRRYYENYSEPWEQLALIRARQVCGPELPEFEEMRRGMVFERPHGDWFVDQLLAMRSAIEGLRTDRDLKRGVGGIRDIEFLTQILQMLSGNEQRFTLDALAVTKISAADKAYLAESYTFYRRLEHRIQLGEGLQTHDLPENERELARVAHLMGFASGADLEHELAERRDSVRDIYNRTLGQGDSANEPSMVPAALARLRETAPFLAAQVEAQPALLDQVLSGEIEEDLPPWSGHHPELRRLVILTRFALGFDDSPWASLSDLADAMVAKHLASSALTAVTLGSFAARELGPASDLDMLFLANGDQSHAEREVEAALRRWPKEPFELDLRLRPNAGRGLLAPTPDALLHYAETEMENWERLALRRFRTSLPETSIAQANRLDWTPETIAELRAMKARIETERSRGEHDLKLGPGGIDDLQWAMQISALNAGRALPTSTPEALDALGQQDLIPIWRDLLRARYASYVATGEPDFAPKGSVSGRHLIRELLENAWRVAQSK